MVTPPLGYAAITPPTAGEDASRIIQQALDQRRQVALLPGMWVCKQSLLWDDGMDLWGDKGAVLARGFNSANATKSAFIQNRDWSRRVKDTRLWGHFDLKAMPGMKGTLIGLLVDGFTSNGWETSFCYRHTMIGGDNIDMSGHKWRCHPNAESGDAGLRFAGGRKFRGRQLDIICGDDALQVVPAGAKNDPLFNCGDTDDAWYSDCLVQSLSARTCIVALQDANNDGSTTLGMKVSVKNVRFTGIKGKGGGSAVVVKNNSSTGGITDIVFDGIDIDQADAEKGQPAEVYLLSQGKTGKIDRITFNNTVIRNPHKRLYQADGPVGMVAGKVEVA